MHNESSNVVLPMPDGGRIELIDMLGANEPASQTQRNIFRFSGAGDVVWQVGEYDAFSNSTFTNIYFDSKEVLLGYNYNGIEYRINLETGAVKPNQLLK